MEATRRQGRRLALANLILANLVAAGILIVGGFNIETLLDGVLATLTKIGVPWFILAMICAPLNELFHNSTTKWLYTNRRYIGLSFAAWHLMHWPILISVMVLMGPSEFWAAFAGMLPSAGSVLLVVTLMAATSNDGAVKLLGRTLWNAIHKIGLYTIWIWYLHVYFSRLPNQPTYVYIYVGLLFAAAGFRWIMFARRLILRALNHSRTERGDRGRT